MSRKSKVHSKVDVQLFRNIMLETVSKNEKRPKSSNDSCNESNIVKQMENCNLTQPSDCNFKTYLNKSIGKKETCFSEDDTTHKYDLAFANSNSQINEPNISQTVGEESCEDAFTVSIKNSRITPKRERMDGPDNKLVIPKVKRRNKFLLNVCRTPRYPCGKIEDNVEGTEQPTSDCKTPTEDNGEISDFDWDNFGELPSLNKTENPKTPTREIPDKSDFDTSNISDLYNKSRNHRQYRSGSSSRKEKRKSFISCVTDAEFSSTLDSSAASQYSGKYENSEEIFSRIKKDEHRSRRSLPSFSACNRGFSTFSPFNERRSNKHHRRRSDIPRISLRKPNHNSKFNCVDSYWDDEFRTYLKLLQNKHDIDLNNCITEIEMDLFDLPENYSLAHCVAEDFLMSSGIAVEFRQRFGKIAQLLEQGCGPGSVAVLPDRNRFLYYLVTKEFSYSKPTLLTLFKSLIELKKHILASDIKRLAMPKIGCGLDKLEWESVRIMINFLFGEMGLEIKVCKLSQTEAAVQRKMFKNRLTKQDSPLTEIKQRLIILYFTDENGSISEDMRQLHGKVNFLAEFVEKPKELGSPVLITRQNFTLAGCVVRKQKEDKFDFLALEKCVNYLNDMSGMYQINNIGFKTVKSDKGLDEKIVNILRTNSKCGNVLVYYPAGNALKMEMWS